MKTTKNEHYHLVINGINFVQQPTSMAPFHWLEKHLFLEKHTVTNIKRVGYRGEGRERARERERGGGREREREREREYTVPTECDSNVGGTQPHIYCYSHHFPLVPQCVWTQQTPKTYRLEDSSVFHIQCRTHSGHNLPLPESLCPPPFFLPPPPPNLSPAPDVRGPTPIHSVSAHFAQGCVVAERSAPELFLRLWLGA